MISNSDRLIVALDFPDITTAKNLVNELGDSVNFYKIGLELLMSGDYFQLVRWLEQKNKKVFADLKLLDISETVGRAVKNLSQYKNIHFLTIHAASKDIMSKAVQNKDAMKILAVTILTNLDRNDLSDMGFDEKIPLENLVLKRAKLANDCKVDGIVCSAFEANIIREKIGPNLTIITPGIRMEKIENDDQKRIANVKIALANGADYIVVGRPITRAQNPKVIAEKFQQEIANFYLATDN